MTLCDDGHKEVCFEGAARDCPVCRELLEVTALESVIEMRDQQLDERDQTIKELTERLEVSHD